MLRALDMYEFSDIQKFSIVGPCLITPKSFGDDRGLFSENWRSDVFSDMVGQWVQFVQDNIAISTKARTIRGLHAQHPPHAIGKLIQVLRGAVHDVAIDIRKGSPTYGKSVSVNLNAQDRQQFWIPEGFLHGYETLEDDTLILYKQTGYFTPEAEISIRWDDPDIGIEWKTEEDRVIVSQKDLAARGLAGFNSPFV